MTGGRASREKGNRTELHFDAAIDAQHRHGYITAEPFGGQRHLAARCRGNGFRELYKWLDGADMLIVRADRRELVIVVPLKLAPEIAAMAERAKGTAP